MQTSPSDVQFLVRPDYTLTTPTVSYAHTVGSFCLSQLPVSSVFSLLPPVTHSSFSVSIWGHALVSICEFTVLLLVTMVPCLVCPFLCSSLLFPQVSSPCHGRLPAHWIHLDDDTVLSVEWSLPVMCCHV